MKLLYAAWPRTNWKDLQRVDSLAKRQKQRHSTFDRQEWHRSKAFTCRLANQAYQTLRCTIFRQSIFGNDLKSSNECLGWPFWRFVLVGTRLRTRSLWSTCMTWARHVRLVLDMTAPARLQVMQHSLNFYPLSDTNCCHRARNQNHFWVI